MLALVSGSLGALLTLGYQSVITLWRSRQRESVLIRQAIGALQMLLSSVENMSYKFPDRG
jgi:hypothetical protein